MAVQFLISSAVKKSLLGSKLTYRHIYFALIYRSFGAPNLILPTQVDEKNIFVTVNTIVDAVFQTQDISKEESEYPRHNTEGLFPRHCPPTGECGFPRAPQKHHPGASCDPREVLTARHLPDAPPPRKMVEQFNIPLCGISVVAPAGFLKIPAP